jgi:hypothetical protein
MKRLHVHVAVDNLADSIRFYSGMFASEPTVMKTDYAKWQLDDPRVNFAISQRGAQIGLNHLGIQVESASELGEMQSRLAALQTRIVTEEGESCCYAKSDKYWVNDPSGIAWETFHTLESIPVFGEHCKNPAAGEQAAQSAACCVPQKEKASSLPCCAPQEEKATTRACC